MTTPIDAWKAIMKFHEEQLVIAKAIVNKLEAPAEERLTDEEMEKRVIALEKRKKYKSSWKRAVEGGLLQNVENILDDCYDNYTSRLETGFTFSKKAKELLGKHGSMKWQLFVLDVIAKVKNDGAFEQENTIEFNDFEDTAGGCDEIVYNAGFDIIAAAEPVTPPS